MAKNKEQKQVKEAKVKSPRFKEIRDAYSITKSVKPWIGAVLALIVIGIFAAAVLLGALLGHPIYAGFIGLPTSLIVALIFFTRIAGSAA